MTVMHENEKRKFISILQILNAVDTPIGGAKIAEKLREIGLDISQRTARYYLQKMDREELTINLGKIGRKISPKGQEELKSSFIIEKVGLVSSKIASLTYLMDFSLEQLQGKIILNLSKFHKQYLFKAFQQMKAVFEAGLGMGRYVFLGYPGTNIDNIKIGNDTVFFGTVCSVTLNGILLKAGIPTTSRFGGILQFDKWQPLRFKEAINYDGTSIDPLEIFIKGGMTSIKKLTATGNGLIGASFREFPSVALPAVEKIKKRLEEVGLGGIVMLGKPGRPLLDIPVSEGSTGMIVVGGLNPLAAVEETGIPTENLAMKLLFNFNKMVPYTEIKL